MKFPVFSLLAGNLGSRDGFARDCLLQRRVTCELGSATSARQRRRGSRRVQLDGGVSKSVVLLTGDRGFESVSLQSRVRTITSFTRLDRSGLLINRTPSGSWSARQTT